MTRIRDLMTADPIVMDSSTSASDAARRMRDEDVGDVLVREDGQVRGIVTDRDLALRVIADGTDPDAITLGQLRTGELVSCAPDDELNDAVAAMREHRIRRIPVMDGDEAVGVLSIGDLAVTLDPDSALADISAAEGNN